MSETHILLVRHPETYANVNGVFVGRGNSDFTQVGLEQLARAPHVVAEFQPESIWSSPLPRALVLAQAIADVADREVTIDDRIVELDFGDAEGMTYDEVTAKGMSFNYRNLNSPVAPNGESRGEIEARSADFCDDLTRLGGRHVVVTHGGVFRASLVHLLGLASTDIWAFHIHNAQLGYVRVVDGHGMLEEYRRA